MDCHLPTTDPTPQDGNRRHCFDTRGSASEDVMTGTLTVTIGESRAAAGRRTTEVVDDNGAVREACSFDETDAAGLGTETGSFNLPFST